MKDYFKATVYLCPNCGLALNRVDYVPPEYFCEVCNFSISSNNPELKKLKRTPRTTNTHFHFF